MGMIRCDYDAIIDEGGTAPHLSERGLSPMAQQEEVPKVRILPPPTRPVLPEIESEVPAVRERTARSAPGKRVSTSHTIAVGDDMYALLLHAKHALEVRERRLVSF